MNEHPHEREHRLAQTWPYTRVRYPQYVAVVLIMFGFLLQWPTLILFPILVTVYTKLAKHEEQEVLEEFGLAYRDYQAHTPAFVPRITQVSNTGSVS